MPTLDTLNALANAVPAMNERAAKKAQAQKTTQLQTQLGAAPAATPAGVSGTRMAQAAAPQAVEQQAAPAVAATAATTNQLGQIAQTGLAVQQTNDQANLAAQQQQQQRDLAAKESALKLKTQRDDLAMRKRVTGNEQASANRLSKLGIEMDNKLQLATIRQREQLTRLGGDVKDKILDSRLRFERDDMGRKFTNDRQLADYNLSNAKTEVEFKDKMREMQQVRERKIQILEVAERKMREAVERGFLSNQQRLDGESRMKIIKAAADIREKIREETARANNIQQGFMAAGGIIGAFFGPVGFAAGTAVGSGIGSVAADADSAGSV